MTKLIGIKSEFSKRMHWFFKFLIVLIFILSLILSICYSIPKILPDRYVKNTKVKGIIVRNQFWEGDIQVIGDLFALPGTTITVLPGTRIRVATKEDKFNLDYLPWHKKSGINTSTSSHGVDHNEPFWDEAQKIQLHFGNFYAIGTKELPIVIQSDAEHPSPYDFNSISAIQAELSNVKLSNYRRLEVGDNSSISESDFNDIGECGLCIRKAKITVSKNNFRNIYREAIWIESGSPRIVDNLFINMKGRGIVIDSKQIARPQILYNDFEMPEKEVLVLLTGAEINPGEVNFNTFSGNSIIKIACDSKLKFSQNNILSVISFIGNGCGGEYIFGPNFWGTLDVKALLQERITNKDRNFKVTIQTLLINPVKAAGKRQ